MSSYLLCDAFRLPKTELRVGIVGSREGFRRATWLRSEHMAEKGFDVLIKRPSSKSAPVSAIGRVIYRLVENSTRVEFCFARASFPTVVHQNVWSV